VLTELRIRNLAIVEDAVIPFGAGLNVMTGSTGAGKSIILAAVELLSGARARKTMLRKGAENLTVEGIFSVGETWPLRRAFGMDTGDAEVSIRRELSEQGKNRIWINGRLSTVASSQEAARSLIELHGQHRQQDLLDAVNHLRYLDAWGDYGELLDRSAAAVARFMSATRRLRDCIEKETEHRSQEDYLRFQVAELEELRLEPDLDRKLESRIRQLEHRQRFVSALEESLHLLDGESGSALERVSRAARSLETIATIDGGWGEAAEGLRSSRIAMQEVSRKISQALAEIEEASEDVESLQERLAGIQRACRKYKLDVSGLMGKRDEIRVILKSLHEGSTAIADAGRERVEAKRELVPMLEELSRRRAKNALDLDRHVTEELQKLGMKGALFTTRIERIENSALQDDRLEIDLSPRGWDRVEFMVRTNVGEEAHPLADIVSGGELSRITLVLKKLEVEEKRIPTLIFDEIDAGLGADLGAVVADRLSELAKTYQIICITHLPQVAARATRHIQISKRVKGNRTVASAKLLEETERVGELARMLGGRGTLREELAAELLAANRERP